MYFRYTGEHDNAHTSSLGKGTSTACHGGTSMCYYTVDTQGHVQWGLEDTQTHYVDELPHGSAVV